MKLEEAVKIGKQIHREAWAKEKKKYGRRQATVAGILIIFADEVRKNDYGTPLPTTEGDRKRLTGILRMLKSEGMAHAEIYHLFKQIVSKWDQLSLMSTITTKGNVWHLGARPNIRDVVMCYQSILSNMAELEDRAKAVTVEVVEDRPVKKRKPRKKLTPSQDDIDAEYQRTIEWEK